MPDLTFKIDSACVVPFAAVPMLAFQMQIKNSMPDEAIHTIALRCQIQIETTHRRYTSTEQAQMLDLFGQPDRWTLTLRSLLWTHVNWVVPTFNGPSTTLDMQVPCSFDFNVAATKYFAGLSDGDIPLLFLFSGTVFYALPDSPLQVAPISWEQEARFKLPARLWRDMMDSYYPNSVWINLHKDVFERVYRYKMQHGLLNWEQALERMLADEVEVNS